MGIFRYKCVLNSHQHNALYNSGFAHVEILNLQRYFKCLVMKHCVQYKAPAMYYYCMI